NLKSDKNILQENKKKENEQLQKKLTVQDIDIEFTNKKGPDVGKTVRLELEEKIRFKLSSIMTQNIESVADNRELIYLIDNESYEVKIQSLVIYSTVIVVLKVTEVS